MPVRRLLPDDRLWPVDDRGRHLLAALGRQAVEEDRLRLGQRHQLLGHLEGRECRRARLALGLLAHRGPDVGVDRVGAGDGRGGIVDDGQLGT